MSIIHDMMVEVERCMRDRGMPVEVLMSPITKHSLESELRLRSSFNKAAAQKNPMVINMLYQVDEKGKKVLGGWEIPVKGDNHVPMGDFWIGVDGYEISSAQLGRKIPHSFLKFPGRN